MAPSAQRSSVKSAHKRERFAWIRGVIVSLGFVASLAFIILAVLIVQSQGPTQSAIILSIITSVGGFVIGVFSLVFSFLQWHHPQSVDHRSESALASLSQTPTLERSELLWS